jgi:hypothetical protein
VDRKERRSDGRNLLSLLSLSPIRQPSFETCDKHHFTTILLIHYTISRPTVRLIATLEKSDGIIHGTLITSLSGASTLKHVAIQCPQTPTPANVSCCCKLGAALDVCRCS